MNHIYLLSAQIYCLDPSFMIQHVWNPSAAKPSKFMVKWVINCMKKEEKQKNEEEEGEE